MIFVLLQIGDKDPIIKKSKFVHALKHTSQNLACTLCSSPSEQATDKFDTFSELLQKGDEYILVLVCLKNCELSTTKSKLGFVVRHLKYSQ